MLLGATSMEFRQGSSVLTKVFFAAQCLGIVLCVYLLFLRWMELKQRYCQLVNLVVSAAALALNKMEVKNTHNICSHHGKIAKLISANIAIDQGSILSTKNTEKKSDIRTDFFLMLALLRRASF
jgi:hypothetical protein